ncbi:hypothetical protein TKK_0018252 [Trichogramma kaykai]
MGASKSKSFSPKRSTEVKPSKSSNFSMKAENYDKTEVYVEDVVCKETDIQENEMKLLPLGDDGKILLIKQKGELHAIGTKCTHYGALLHTGALGEGRVRCPWHGACFNIKTGDIEDFPGLDSLPCYQVSVDKGLVKVKAKQSELLGNKRVKGMVRKNKCNSETIVIVGGGPAGATCAETLRQEGFEGRIILICKEGVFPYDRVKLSKAMDTDVQNILLRPQCFYEQNNIETVFDIEAVKLDSNKKTVYLTCNQEYKYSKIFLATGSQARRPDLPGVNLQNIFVLKDFKDSNGIHKLLKEDVTKKNHIVVLGTGFIGMEAAAYCADKCASVTVIGRDCVPFKSVFGEEIGMRIKKEFQNKGVKFIDNNCILKFIPREDDEKLVGKVQLKEDLSLKADIVILGIGSNLTTTWLKDSGLQMTDNCALIVDEYLKTNIDDVYAGGDIAYAPVYCAKTKAAIGHYGLAHYHGKIAAMNMCGNQTPLQAVPFFWTTLFGKSYRYAGFGIPDKVKIVGSLEEMKFFAYYIKNCKVIAMSSVGRDPIVSDFANYLYEGKTLTEDEVEKDPIAWIRNKPKDLQTMPISTSISRFSQQQKYYHTLTPLNVSRNCYNSIQFKRCTHFIRIMIKLL